MSFFAPFAMIFLVMLTQAFLQLSPGLFAIFYHSALAKTSAKKADDMSLSFILGAEIFIAIAFLSVYFIISAFYANSTFIDDILPWILICIILAESITTFFFYFRRGKTTALYISRDHAKKLAVLTRSTKKRSDAIVLGIVSESLETLFTIPLFITASFAILKNNILPDFSVLILYIVVAIAPLFIIRNFYRSGLNLAEIQRLRTKNQPAFRIIISLSLFLLALILIAYKVA